MATGGGQANAADGLAIDSAIDALVAALDTVDAGSYPGHPDWQARFVRLWVVADRWRQQIQAAPTGRERLWNLQDDPANWGTALLRLRNVTDRRARLAALAQLLRSCHRVLRDTEPAVLGDHTYDGVVYRIRPRRRTWDAHSHGDLLLHLCPAVCVVSLAVVQGLELNEVRFLDPFAPLFAPGSPVTVLAYPIWPVHHFDPPAPDEESDAAVVAGPDNHPELCAQVDAAIAAATDCDVLILPELSHSPALFAHLAAALAASNATGPRLTVVGLEHVTVADDSDPAGPRYLNEAVVLDARGGEVARYRKLQEFFFADRGRGERLRPGSSVLLLTTHAGSFAVMICIDCFSEPVKARVRESWASVILVPSLSPKTSAHAAAAGELVGRGIGMAVANWWFDGATPARLDVDEGAEAVVREADSFVVWRAGSSGRVSPDRPRGPVRHEFFPSGT